VRVTSHTAEPTALTAYGPLFDETGRRFALRWTSDGVAEISEIIDGKPVKINNRTLAERLTNTRLFIERDRLPAPDPDEYYLTDLVGLAAFGGDGAPLGVVSAVHDYGAGASLEITHGDGSSLLIPFTAACVPEVDIQAGRLTVAPPDEIEVSETPGSTEPGPRPVVAERADSDSSGHRESDRSRRDAETDGASNLRDKTERAA